MMSQFVTVLLATVATQLADVRPASVAVLEVPARAPPTPPESDAVA